MTATCRRGLPMVVRFLVRSSVRRAAAPESTWIAASRSGVAPAAGGAAWETLGAGAGGEVVVAGAEGGWDAMGDEVAVVVADGGTGGGLGASGCIAFRLVWVSPMDLSAAGGGAALAGFLMIMVFSKSAAVAAGGASLKYLSFCLPISPTSLFCRKCFFTRLPL